MLINEQFIYNLKVLRSKVFNFLPNYLRIKLKKYDNFKRILCE